jgi:hypothetical protein
MLQRTFPGVPDAVDDARAWIKNLVSDGYQQVSAAAAEQVLGGLVAAAISHTPDGTVMEVTVTPRDDGGLTIQVTDPNIPPTTPHEGGWGHISELVRDFGTSNTADGRHIAWCALNPRQLVPAQNLRRRRPAAVELQPPARSS